MTLSIDIIISVILGWVGGFITALFFYNLSKKEFDKFSHKIVDLISKKKKKNVEDGENNPITKLEKTALARGIAAHYDRCYEEAIGHYNDVTKSNPDCGAAYYHKGNAYLALGNRQKGTENHIEAANLENENSRQWCRDNGIPWQLNN